MSALPALNKSNVSTKCYPAVGQYHLFTGTTPLDDDDDKGQENLDVGKDNIEGNYSNCYNVYG